MKSIGLAGQIMLFVIGLLWFIAIGWFVFSYTQWGIFLFLIAGIFISLAFAFSAYMQIKASQPYGMTLVFAGVSMFLTAVEFNYEFLKIDLVHNASMTVVLSLLFFMGVVKIFDTLEYFQ